MKKNLLLTLFSILLIFSLVFILKKEKTIEVTNKTITSLKKKKKKKKTPEQRALYTEERAKYEYKLQANPLTGAIPFEEKELELKEAKNSILRRNSEFAKVPDAAYINRGPSNLGGRTRAIAVDLDVNTGNTLIAGGVSSGAFRTTDGGTSWTKVSPNDEVHNVTTIAQDPRNGFKNVWYYGTGEGIGNSASLSGSIYRGDGIWTSTNNGITWSQMTGTAGAHESFDSFFDYIYTLTVHPTTGDLFAAVGGAVRRFDLGTSTWITEIENGSINSNRHTDVVIASTGRVYAAFSGTNDAATEGVWTSSNGEGGWSRINTPDFTPAGRVVLALAPSNQDKLYALFVNGNNSDCDTTPAIEADLWMWDESIDTWTDFSSKLPDEAGCSDGNDPFAVQGGYDLVVSVKPDNEDFLVIGGTNAYRIGDIVNDLTFSRIGGYNTATGYSLYNTAGGDEHHPDIHALVFNPFNNNELFSGSDGGVHKTNNFSSVTVDWTNLNNNYQTQQFYHVTIDPQMGSDGVIGGLQDNGTNVGGTTFGLLNATTQTRTFGGDGVAVGISRDNACVPFFFGSQSGQIVRDCPTAADITPDNSESQFVTYFHLDPSNNNALYYAGKGILFKTNDATNVTSSVGMNATDWTDMGSPVGFGTGNSDEWISRFSTTWGTYNAGTSYLLIGGDTGSVLRLDDPQNAANVSSAVDITPSGATGVVTGLAIHPSNRDIVLLTYSNYGITNIYLTTNATAASPNWTNVEQNLNTHSIRSAAITEVAGQTLYFVGTARGLYSSTDPLNNNWTIEAQNEIGFAVVSSLAYRPSDNNLLIGTHGNGMYMATISDVLSINTPSNDISNEITLYPNPVVDEFKLKFLNEYSDITKKYSIKNILGQNVMNGNIINNTVNISNLKTGVYFVQIELDNKIGVKKIYKK